MGIQISQLLYLFEQLLQEQECWCRLIPENFAVSLPLRFPFLVIVLASFPKLLPQISCHVAEAEVTKHTQTLTFGIDISNKRLAMALLTLCFC